MKSPIMLAPKGSANYLSFAMPADVVRVRVLYDDGSVVGEKLTARTPPGWAWEYMDGLDSMYRHFGMRPEGLDWVDPDKEETSRTLTAYRERARGCDNPYPLEWTDVHTGEVFETNRALECAGNPDYAEMHIPGKLRRGRGWELVPKPGDPVEPPDDDDWRPGEGRNSYVDDDPDWRPGRGRSVFEEYGYDPNEDNGGRFCYRLGRYLTLEEEAWEDAWEEAEDFIYHQAYGFEGEGTPDELWDRLLENRMEERYYLESCSCLGDEASHLQQIRSYENRVMNPEDYPEYDPLETSDRDHSDEEDFFSGWYDGPATITVTLKGWKTFSVPTRYRLGV